jgi:hypothetical protein
VINEGETFAQLFNRMTDDDYIMDDGKLKIVISKYGDMASDIEDPESVALDITNQLNFRLFRPGNFADRF